MKEEGEDLRKRSKANLLHVEIRLPGKKTKGGKIGLDGEGETRYGGKSRRGRGRRRGTRPNIFFPHK